MVIIGGDGRSQLDVLPVLPPGKKFILVVACASRVTGCARLNYPEPVPRHCGRRRYAVCAARTCHMIITVA